MTSFCVVRYRRTDYLIHDSTDPITESLNDIDGRESSRIERIDREFTIVLPVSNDMPFTLFHLQLF